MSITNAEKISREQEKYSSRRRQSNKRQSRRWKLSLATAVALFSSSVYAPLSNSANFSIANFIAAQPAKAQTIAQSNWAAVEQDLIAEHNRVRQNPQSYIPLLEARLASMDARGNIPNGCGRNCTMLTNEGRPAVEEAIRYLRNQPPVGEVTLSSGISQAAQAHAADQRDGKMGHTGSDGSQPRDRVARFNVENAGVGENIAYGPSTAQAIMISLIVDDGVPSRGHRTNIFRESWAMAGAGCGPHATYRTVCVINYANAPRGASAVDRQFQVVNNGTVELRSLKLSNTETLSAPLGIGQSRTISLNDGCKTNLTIQLGGNYLPLYWNDLDLCAATLTIDAQNSFKVQY